MKTLASYGLPGLEHLKILLVDQHVEGDEETPIQVCNLFIYLFIYLLIFF